MIAIVALVIVAFMFIWIWRTQGTQGQGQLGQGLGTNIFTIPGSAAAPAFTPNLQNPQAPGITNQQGQLCNCTANPSCNAFCSNSAAFSLCCVGGGTTTPPAPVDNLPEEDDEVCSDQFNGSCNTECGVNGDPDECLECNAVCGSDVIYQGPDIPAPANAGAVGGTCNCGNNTYCNQFCNNANMFNLCCFGSATAAPVYPTTPIPPPLSVANPTRCSQTFNGSCNSECSGGSQATCNENNFAVS